jgi:hypothetical protein
MSRRVVLLSVLAVVVAGAGVALVAAARPALDDARRAVDVRWATLRGPLAARYDALGEVAGALAAGGAAQRSYTADLRDALADWQELRGRPDPDAGAEAVSANRLEGLAARVRSNVAQSARLRADPVIGDAVAAFDAALVPPPAVRAYNRAVRSYQSTRRELLHRLPADLLGYGPRPLLVIGDVSK